MSDNNDYFVNNTLPIIILFIIFMIVLVYCLIKRRNRRINEPILNGLPITSDSYVSL